MLAVAVLVSLFLTVCGSASTRAALPLEILALRHQLSGPGTLTSTARAADGIRSAPLDLDLPCVTCVAFCRRHRQTRHRHRLASPRLSAVLDLEESAPSRSPLRRAGHPDVDSHDVGGE